ncbi:MAG: ketoacyl-ACP synthase III [Actinobacteria bacterium]|nr:ketoacyl-ACP synthase III [Actinomycetota bacterium]
MSLITGVSGAPFARMLGVGSYSPARVVTNAEMCERIDSTDEWIRERSGITERRFAAPDETVADMAVAAASKALASAGITADQVDCIIVASVTHLKATPSAAAEVSHRLGAGRAPAFDISAACAGFCYGLSMAQDFIRGGSATYVVVIGVEKLTDIVDPNDRSTAFLFADGAGAAVIGPSDTPAIGPTVWGADGSQLDAITMSGRYEDLRDNDQAEYPHVVMQGQAVFRWAVHDMSIVAQQALDAAGITADQLDAFIPHQANLRIVDAMVRSLKLPADIPVARDIVTSGNTSAASIPLAMDHMLQAGQIRSGGLALLIGFGAGLAYAAQVVELP